MTELTYFKKQKRGEESISSAVIQIKTDDIRPNRAQPRADFDQNSIIRLADSIRRYGILQPLTVREADPDDSRPYELIAGERRLRAAKMLGYLTVPCIIRRADEQTAAELAIIENLLRKDLNMFEEAYGYKMLIECHGLTQEEVARRMSVSQSAVANKLRLLRLSFEDQRIILEHGLTERHGRALLRIDGEALRHEVLERIVGEKLIVGATEALIEDIIAKTEAAVVSASESDGGKSAQVERSRERGLDSTVRSIRKKVDCWVNDGGAAEINVTNHPSAVEIFVKLIK
jgi:ParB family chromosome partitioning protein